MALIEGYGAATPRGYTKKAGQAKVKNKPRPKPKPNYGGGNRGFASQPSYRPTRSVSRTPTRTPSRPVKPVPSADAIADLFNQVAGFKREYGQLGLQHNLQRDQMGAARGLYLKQLADAFGQSRTGALQDYSARGLADSGIAHEGLARMESQYGQQRSAYETDYRNQLAQMLQGLQGRRADILARRRAIESQYNRLRAQRAAALKMAGFG
jgi:hypothetical protein